MWPVSRVNQAVLLQVCQLRERLATDFTGERTFTCMSPQVYLDAQPNTHTQVGEK